MFEKEAEDYAMREVAPRQELYIRGRADIDSDYEKVKKIWQDGAEFGYNKAKEEMQAQDYSLFDFVMQYENGKFKCKYKSGKEFESVDGETWKEIVLPELKESE